MGKVKVPLLKFKLVANNVENLLGTFPFANEKLLEEVWVFKRWQEHHAILLSTNPLMWTSVIRVLQRWK